MSETTLQASVKRALVSIGCMVVRVQSGLFQGVGGHYVRAAQAGTPDLCVLTTSARTVWLETKTPKGRLSEEQERWHAEARRLGHTVVVPRSVREAVEACR